MAEETKKGNFNLKSVLKLLFGVLLVFLGILLTVKFFGVLRLIIAGCIGPFLILVGLITIAIAKE